MSNNTKIIRISTVPGSLNTFCNGLLSELKVEGYDVVAVSSPGPDLDEVASREGVRTRAVPMQRHISPLSDLRSLAGLIKVFRSEKPTMVHSITPKAGLLSMMAAKICRVPVRVHTFTGLVFPTSTGLKKKILMLTDRLTCACATHVVPEGEGVKADLTHYGITHKPMAVLGHGNIRGIDIEHYSPSAPGVMERAAGIRRDGIFTFIFIGRLVGDKGINELVEAFDRLHGEYPQSRLILVGSQERQLDPLSPATLTAIDSNPAIEAVGSQSDVRPWLAASDALVFPSYREGFPNVVIEAGAMGLPSIVTDINGSREIIIEGRNGTIVPPRSADALYRAMRRFIDSPEELSKMAAEARPLIASRYEQSYVRRCLKEYYSEVLKDK
ncbi:MAG: glycosyltransferase family 4 protein [Muribaculaceae bacterium]|nr:glycosyltransferase family 4 protein [Muribaculaceae bacterium]